MTGDYILSIASILIARLKNDDVTIVLSEVSTLCGMQRSHIFGLRRIIFYSSERMKTSAPN